MARMPASARARRAPRVVMLTPAFPPEVGGIQLLCARLAELLPRFELTVVAPAARGPSAEATVPLAKRAPAATLRLPGPAPTAALNAYAAALMRIVRPDLILNMHIATAPAAWTARAPYVQYVYASELPPRRALARRALSRATSVVAISSHSRELAISHGADAAKVVTIAPGVDQPATPVSADAPRDSGRLLMVSRMDEHYKGHETLIRALPLVRAAVPQLRARLAGDGRLRPYLESLAASAGVSAAVDFLGQLPTGQRDAELRGASVFCLPSSTPPDGGGEGFGIALLEAGAFAVPVVAGRCGGALDAVADGSTGVLLDDPRDHVELAGALIRLLKDDQLARRMGMAGQEHSQSFSWERTALAVQEVCLAAIGAVGRTRR